MRRFIHNLFWRFANNTYKYWPDSLWLKMIYRNKFHRNLNLSNPQSFNEKLNWLKLYNRNPLYSTLVDKFAVKKYVADLIGEEYVIPCYGVWDSFDEIDFNNLPDKFILKCTHDSGGICICRNRETFDCSEAKDIISKSLKHNFFWWTREWVYKNVKPRVLAEKLMNDHTGENLRDYKFWCFNGKPIYMYCSVKSGDVYESFYDMDYMPVNINHNFPRSDFEIPKPECFEEMKSLALKLSENIPFVRVDFYQVDRKVYFGEFTFYDWGGMRPFESYQQDLDLGKLIQLPPRL